MNPVIIIYVGFLGLIPLEVLTIGTAQAALERWAYRKDADR